MKERGDYALPLHVEVRGSGPPVLLLHGFGAHAFTFRHWSEILAERHEVILVDMKGFGAAPKPEDGCYGPADQANLVVRLIINRDLRDLTLVGHSFGGAVALLVALRLMERGELSRLRGIVSVAGPAYRQEYPTYIGIARRRKVALLLLRLVPTRWLIRKVLESIVFDVGSITRTQVEAYAEPLATREGQRALVATAQQIEPPDLDEIVARYPDLDVPILILWGRHDPVVPLRVGERLANDLPHGRLVVVEECGHDPPEECPRKTAEILQRFIDETAGHDAGSPAASDSAG